MALINYKSKLWTFDPSQVKPLTYLAELPSSSDYAIFDCLFLLGEKMIVLVEFFSEDYDEEVYCEEWDLNAKMFNLETHDVVESTLYRGSVCVSNADYSTFID